MSPTFPPRIRRLVLSALALALAAAILPPSAGCYRRVVRATGVGNPNGDVWEANVQQNNAGNPVFFGEENASTGQRKTKKKPGN